jgi:hypothetical protein
MKHLFLLGIFCLLLTQTTSSHSSIPQESKPHITRTIVHSGNEYTVTVTINSPGITGFAKYTDLIPKGATAIVVDKSSSEINSTDGMVKFVWVSYPSSRTVSLSYKIVYDGFPIVNYKGAFRYISNNVVAEVELGIDDIRLIER